MQDETDGVVQPLGFGESFMTTFVSEDPNPSQHPASYNSIGEPEGTTQ